MKYNALKSPQKSLEGIFPPVNEQASLTTAKHCAGPTVTTLGTDVKYYYYPTLQMRKLRLPHRDQLVVSPPHKMLVNETYTHIHNMLTWLISSLQ